MKAFLLNGTPRPEPTAELARDLLGRELRERGWELDELVLRDEKIAYCVGCLGCWLKTPGQCVVPDAGRKVPEGFITSDLVIYLTPVVFGGYSSELKKALDRMIPIIMPFFTRVRGEVHHSKRYATYPSMVALGVLAEPDEEAAGIFRTLHARNAINAHAPRSSAAAVSAGQGEADLRTAVKSLLDNVEVAS